MALDIDITKKRLKEAFGSDSQETVGKKLNMTQGNVSKLLSGNQQPTLETIYHVAEAYDVSVDWLLGLTDRKIKEKTAEGTTYMSAASVLSDMISWGSAELVEENGSMTLRLKDPLIKNLVKKSQTLRRTDRELNKSWEESKLSLFADCPLVSEMIWRDSSITFLVNEAVTEPNWKEVYIAAKEKQKDLENMFGPDSGPFGE